LIWRNAADVPDMVAILVARSESGLGPPGATSLTAAVLVLVVAPDKDFRRSLEFALEAEGFVVDAHATTSNAFDSQRAHEADCAVVDDAAIDDWRTADQEFRRFRRPVVLLVGKIRPMPDLLFATILTKPFLGNPLIEAVRDAVMGSA
jgi:CheY-like chemotaxis protein